MPSAFLTVLTATRRLELNCGTNGMCGLGAKRVALAYWRVAAPGASCKAGLYPHSHRLCLLALIIEAKNAILT